MQQLQVNLTIPVPDNYVLINRVEYEELQTNSLQGVYWTMSDLENRIGKKTSVDKRQYSVSTKIQKTIRCFARWICLLSKS